MAVKSDKCSPVRPYEVLFVYRTAQGVLKIRKLSAVQTGECQSMKRMRQAVEFVVALTEIDAGLVQKRLAQRRESFEMRFRAG